MSHASQPSEPRVSVVIPVYRSEGTLQRCLETMTSQEFPDYEVVVVDSSPHGGCEAIAAGFPEVLYRRSRERLFPHAARNLGVALSRGELLVFTDPDIYAPPRWLTEIVAAHEEHGGAIVGALENHGDGWFDRGVHWTKFSKWLPARHPTEVDMGPTANLLCPRSEFQEIGGFPGENFLGDVVFSRRLRARGGTLRLAPRAAVEHDHRQTLRSFLKERYSRGVLLATLEMAEEEAGWPRRWWRAVITGLPLRLGSNLFHVVRHAVRSRRIAELATVLPVVFLGYSASLLGETRGFLAPPAVRPAAARAARTP